MCYICAEQTGRGSRVALRYPRRERSTRILHQCQGNLWESGLVWIIVTPEGCH